MTRCDTTLKSSCASATTRSPSTCITTATARDWTELDVEGVLKSMLLAIDRVKNPRGRGAHRAPPRVQLDCRADRRRRGDCDGDSERRCRCRALRHRAAAARRDDHAHSRRGARSEARRALTRAARARARTKTEIPLRNCDGVRSRNVAVLPSFSRYAPGTALARARSTLEVYVPTGS